MVSTKRMGMVSTKRMGMVDVTEANVQLVNRSTIFIVHSAGSDGGNSNKKVCSYNIYCTASIYYRLYQLLAYLPIP